MSYDAATPLRNEVDFELSGPWAAYWVAMLRVLTGWWFFHSGVGKLLDSGLNFGAAGYLQGMSGTTLGPLATFLAGFPDLLGALVPLGETAIGLGLMLGVLVRLASFFGVLFMSLFFVGNASFGHGLVNSDLMGMLLFVTIIVFAAGRYYGLDALVERTEFVRNRPRLKYLLG
ncbi:DoxX family protein [Halobacterium sp. KA-6]|uniref:DoxX family protein n=1 Tax=Halobacterium sp. KA-6 TaxID=2896368 RepID=UPI001E2ECF64|nr:DoxX family protein [Halobacterium sp. KA-6]MCD2203216.1 DoxX family protein [Halobacterium sp. KA-6]